jgi:hypothetical protein
MKSIEVLRLVVDGEHCVALVNIDTVFGGVTVRRYSAGATAQGVRFLPIEQDKNQLILSHEPACLPFIEESCGFLNEEESQRVTAAFCRQASSPRPRALSPGLGTRAASAIQ